jgi:hypothetical protein
MTFRSFFMAGFECATGLNVDRNWIDQIEATQHDRFLRQDYGLLSDIGIHTIREGVRWPLVDIKGTLNLAEVERVIKAANREGAELILDLFHYGYPQDVDIFSEAFADRFADYCCGVAKIVAKRAEHPVHFTPVNEPSYFAWAAGEAARFAPYATGRAFEMKVSMVRAAIRGIEAIWSVLPNARIVNVDPVCRVAAPLDDHSREADVDFFNNVAVFECWDMLAGKLLPELGGSPKHLDIVGINYYWTNQWEIDRTDEPLAMDDPRLTPLRDIVRAVWERYGQPMIISETSHVEHMRGPWLRYVVEEIEALRIKSVPLEGICIYPVLGMPEWHEREVWVRMGLWDCIADGRGHLRRVPDAVVFEEYFDAARRFREIEAGKVGSPS